VSAFDDVPQSLPSSFDEESLGSTQSMSEMSSQFNNLHMVRAPAPLLKVLQIGEGAGAILRSMSGATSSKEGPSTAGSLGATSLSLNSLKMPWNVNMPWNEEHDRGSNKSSSMQSSAAPEWLGSGPLNTVGSPSGKGRASERSRVLKTAGAASVSGSSMMGRSIPKSDPFPYSYPLPQIDPLPLSKQIERVAGVPGKAGGLPERLNQVLGPHNVSQKIRSQAAIRTAFEDYAFKASGGRRNPPNAGIGSKIV